MESEINRNEQLTDKSAGKKVKNFSTLILTVVLTFSVAYFIGFGYGLSQSRNITISGLTGAGTPSGLTADFSVFWEAWDKLKSMQINAKKINNQDMVYGAIKGIAGSLDDPYTVFFNPDDSKKFQEEVDGNFGGVGAEIGIKDKQLMIIAPLKNTPAIRADLKAKDMILKIDDKLTDGLTVEEAVSLIRGTIGTKVKLTIFRDGWAKPKVIELTRENIQTPTVDWSIKNNDVIYLQLYSFNKNAGVLFQQAVTEAKVKGGKRMVLDLRNNPGGYLEVAQAIAGLFIKEGDVVVKERFTDGNENVLKAEGDESLMNMPVVVLINEGSASAAEILAGALKVDRKTDLVGEKSFGKGTVQQIIKLKDDSTLKITIANWLLPDGTLIDKNGIEPNYKVEITEGDIKAEKDPQLEKALEIIKTK
jgi:carboxyl-terminal processing protease